MDTDGRALVLQTHPASVQDRDGAVPLLRASRRSFPFVEHVFADTVYAGDRVANATRIVVEIVRKLPDQVGFAVLPRRWVVILCTMLPSWALSGHPRSSEAAAAGC